MMERKSGWEEARGRRDASVWRDSKMPLAVGGEREVRPKGIERKGERRNTSLPLLGGFVKRVG